MTEVSNCQISPQIAINDAIKPFVKNWLIKPGKSANNRKRPTPGVSQGDFRSFYRYDVQACGENMLAVAMLGHIRYWHEQGYDECKCSLDFWQKEFGITSRRAVRTAVTALMNSQKVVRSDAWFNGNRTHAYSLTEAAAEEMGIRRSVRNDTPGSAVNDTPNTACTKQQDQKKKANTEPATAGASCNPGTPQQQSNQPGKDNPKPTPTPGPVRKSPGDLKWACTWESMTGQRVTTTQARKLKEAGRWVYGKGGDLDSLLGFILTKDAKGGDYRRWREVVRGVSNTAPFRPKLEYFASHVDACLAHMQAHQQAAEATAERAVRHAEAEAQRAARSVHDPMPTQADFDAVQAEINALYPPA
jgi:hypothetical protein